MEQFESALASARIKITKYDPSKQRPVSTDIGTMSVEKFCAKLRERLGPDLVKFPVVVEASFNQVAMGGLLEDACRAAGTLVGGGSGEYTVPAEMAGYILNRDVTAVKPQDRYFLTTSDEEYISRTTGEAYIDACSMTPGQVRIEARRVVPLYQPRSARGVVEATHPITKELEQIFNTYIPPRWAVWAEENKKEYARLPRSLPPLFVKMIRHMVPDKDERLYMYGWLYGSMVGRSYVYLVLCGVPGVGKGVLQSIFSSLHGHMNSASGKRNTLTGNFNSALVGKTLLWFDELNHNREMHNVMKALQMITSPQRKNMGMPLVGLKFIVASLSPTTTCETTISGLTQGSFHPSS